MDGTIRSLFFGALFEREVLMFVGGFIWRWKEDLLVNIGEVIGVQVNGRKAGKLI
jgi:hypothetical protein